MKDEKDNATKDVDTFIVYYLKSINFMYKIKKKEKNFIN